MCSIIIVLRLICEKTVEENILRKANQKRLLNELTIEGGNFTTALLKRNLIAELFEDNINSTTEITSTDVVESEPVTEPLPVQEVEQQPPPIPMSSNVSATVDFEKALALVEDESDVKAADELRREVRADYAEFDENQQLIGTGEEVATAEDEAAVTSKSISKVESEFKVIENQVVYFFSCT